MNDLDFHSKTGNWVVMEAGGLQSSQPLTYLAVIHSQAVRMSKCLGLCLSQAVKGESEKAEEGECNLFTTCSLKLVLCMHRLPALW